MKGIKFEEYKECTCDESTCVKCLGGNCRDDGCKTHRLFDKARRRQYVLEDLISIVNKFEKMEKKGAPKEELNEHYNYRRLSEIRDEIKAYKKEVERLNELVKKGYARRI